MSFFFLDQSFVRGESSIYIGCFEDKPERALPNYKPDKHGRDKCLAFAAENKYEIFALQYNGECWVDDAKINNYDKYGKFPDENCNSGVGGGYANAVYKILCKSHL